MSGQTEVKFEAGFEKKISRLFIFRPLYMFIEMWVIMVWGMWMGIITTIHFWYMLILGQRSDLLWKKQLRFTRHIAKWNAYMNALTDKVPEWVEE
jgi:hypothetical protein